ncbi:MAG: histidine kinase N-terminal 7TM domain-containing protein [Peptococcaceae bacterium]|jgi:signal transduction histidine kinase|nr:histidine kinase [Peptococcaceae bacterium]MDH7525518.1 histidine kinase N-terminal 7TM domain-containing protein [Peptococcaceae bacterium]
MSFDLEWLYDIFILEIWHVFSIIVAVALACYIYLQARRNALFYHYMLLQGILLAWLICKVFKTVAPTVELKWAFIVAQYLPVCFMGSALLMFGYVYARGRPLSWRFSIPLNIPPALFFLVVATNEKHHLFYSSYDFLGDTFGPLFYAYTAVTYLYLAIGIGFCATRFHRQPGKKSMQARLLTMGIIIPLAVNALYIAGLIEPRFDLTPVSCNASLALFAYAIYKYRFLDIVPLGIALSFNNLQEGVMVFDKNGQILDCNKAFCHMFDLAENDMEHGTVDGLDRSIAAVCREERIIRNLMDAMPKSQGLAVSRDLIVTGAKYKYLTVQVKPLKTSGKGQERGTGICICYDNSEYRELIKQLEKKNSELGSLNSRLREHAENLRQLAIIGERNRMAREIHDVLGHSLVLVLKILESSYLLADTDCVRARVKARQALDCARQGLDELRNAKSGGKNSASLKTIEALEGDLDRLVGKYRQAGMKVDLMIVSGHRRGLPSDLYHTIYRICQEALTNSLRHGRAEQATVYLRFNARETQLYILDNGRGCPEIKRGNGLNGMEQRLKDLGGTLTCGSQERAGFIIRARIPY